LGKLGVVIFSSKPPREIARLVLRLAREVPGARLHGVLCERPKVKSTSERFREFASYLAAPPYYSYAATQALRALRRPFDALGRLLLRLAHACPPQPNGSPAASLAALEKRVQSLGGSLFVTGDINSAEAREYVRALRADLGLLYGTRLLLPELYNLPRLGSIALTRRKLPDYRGATPVGLWEMLDDQKEIGVTVHRVEKELATGAILRAATILIEPFDTLHSLALKAGVVGEDLLLRVTADFVAGAVKETPQNGGGRAFPALKPHELARYEKELARRRPAYRPPRGRPGWNLLLRSLLFGPVAIARNWVFRARKKFPVVILYHHVIADRPHHLGLSTDAFYRQAEFLTRYYRVASLQEALEMLSAGRVEAPTVVLTFDDGYADNFINLRAVAQAKDLPATLFVSTGHVSNGQPFLHDLRRQQHNFRPLTWEQVCVLSQSGFELGGHTRSHFDCGSTDRVALEDEIVGCKRDLEEHLGKPVALFSFPWGMEENMSRPAVELARAHFECIFDAAGGVNPPTPGERPWFLRRCDHVSDLWELELLLQHLLNVRRIKEALPGIAYQPART